MGIEHLLARLDDPEVLNRHWKIVLEYLSNDKARTLTPRLINLLNEGLCYYYGFVIDSKYGTKIRVRKVVLGENSYVRIPDKKGKWKYVSAYNKTLYVFQYKGKKRVIPFHFEHDKVIAFRRRDRIEGVLEYVSTLTGEKFHLSLDELYCETAERAMKDLGKKYPENEFVKRVAVSLLKNAVYLKY